jgi:multiple sugar transport system permease protein
MTRWATPRIRNFVRGLLILPWLFSLAAAGLIWGLLYQSTGPVNYLLLSSGIVSQPIDFFGDPKLAIWSLIFINVWKSYPFYLVMILGALQTIPEELWEAAKIDGASALQRFWHVTLPMLKPVLIASTAIDMITTVTTFDLVKIMTNGGPMRSTQTLAFYIWQEGFRDVNFGYGAAMSVVMLVTLCIATLFYLRVSRGSMREGDAAMAL